MKMEASDRMRRILVYAMLFLFTLGVLVAGWITKFITDAPKPELMSDRIADFLLAISNTLALNLGAYLGISAAVANWEAEPTGNLQKAAAYVYVVDVVLAVILWALTGFTGDDAKVAKVLPAIATGGLGLMLAALGAFLGVGKVFRAEIQAAVSRPPSG